MPSPSPQKTARQPASVVDSPWFWLAMFCTMALVGLAAIWPKFAQRSQRLDRQAQVREQVWRQRVQPGEAQLAAQPAAQTSPSGEQTTSRGQAMPIVPLAALLTLLVVVSSALLVRRARQNRPGTWEERD